jgi:hypothetical protein
MELVARFVCVPAVYFQIRLTGMPERIHVAGGNVVFSLAEDKRLKFPILRRH